MGTTSATIKFTKGQFDKIVVLAKTAIKANKNGDADDAYEELEEFVETIAKKQKEKTFAIMEALLNFFDNPRRPSTIANALKKKGVWSGEWEEGSFAFGTTQNKAREAVRKIEAEHCMDDW